MTTFNNLGLSDKVLSAVKRMGFEKATPVQEQAIPLVLEGRDIIAAAQTGTGKTAAFTLPSMDMLEHAEAGRGPLMLVATPGRLIDLMEHDHVDLSHVQVLVLDEADRMLDMGFLPSVKRIVAATPAKRQTLLFSATIDKSIKNVAKDMLRDPATVQIARKGDVADTVDQYIFRVPQSVKPALIRAVLEEKGAERVIVFARTRSRADTCCKKLRRAGYAVESIHSDRSQNQRRRALDKFAKGEVNIITATDVLARGIDVDQVDYVINYDAPEQAEDYIHRIGRTGRAGQRGFAVTFVTPETEGELRAIEKLVKRSIPELQLENFDLAAAEAEAAERSITAQSKRDPEVNRVKRELANKAQKKEQAKQSAEEAEKKHQGPARKRRKGKPVQNGRNGAPARNEAQPRKKSVQPKHDSHAKGDAQAKRDMRPGRSHRAEVQRARSRKHR